MSSNEKKINAVFILEVLGRPAEFLTETLNDLVKRIGQEKGIKLRETKINPPVIMKEQKDFYTSFAEIEIEAEELLSIVGLMFKYMPAYVEITSPQNIQLTNASFGEILNELTRRLHGYEEITRILQTEKTILEKKLRESLGEEVKEKNKKRDENK
ncbi:Uncharacterised protein [uncultured archaeon]|nr:Uncharacterised protein [uncultured archaeon]